MDFGSGLFFFWLGALGVYVICGIPLSYAYIKRFKQCIPDFSKNKRLNTIMFVVFVMLFIICNMAALFVGTVPVGLIHDYIGLTVAFTWLLLVWGIAAIVMNCFGYWVLLNLFKWIYDWPLSQKKLCKVAVEGALIGPGSAFIILFLFMSVEMIRGFFIR